MFSQIITNLKRRVFKGISKKNPTIFVHIHLYYTDLWGEFKTYLKNISHDYSLIITWPEEDKRIKEDILKFKTDTIILTVPNKGKDIGGFIHALKYINLDSNENLILKIHTKKSPRLEKVVLPKDEWIKSGTDWRIKLLNSLLSSEKKVNTILKIFQHDRTIGMIGTKELLRDTQNDYPNDTLIYKKTCNMFGMDTKDTTFIAGTMFWARASLFKTVKEKLSIDDFDESKNDAIDGQIEHAMERIFCKLNTLQNMTIKGI